MSLCPCQSRRLSHSTPHVQRYGGKDVPSGTALQEKYEGGGKKVEVLRKRIKNLIQRTDIFLTEKLFNYPWKLNEHDLKMQISLHK